MTAAKGLFFGGFHCPNQSPQPDVFYAKDVEAWSCRGPGGRAFYEDSNSSGITVQQGSQLASIWGYVANSSRNSMRKQLEGLLQSYHYSGRLELLDIDGSFTLLLLDASAGRIKLYRNLVGNTATYYSLNGGSFVFGDVLANVVRRAGRPPSVRRDMLPVYFTYRFVPGPNTLFEGIYRLQPGEMVTYENGRVTRQMVRTFADLDEPHKTDEVESVERVEATMRDVLRNHMMLEPCAANLLSGGVDSTYIQVIWNQLLKDDGAEEAPNSVAVWVDHPKMIADQEYCASAVKETGTKHVSVSIPPLSADLMKSVLASTGEMPNHVQSFYFGELAHAMAEDGLQAGLCGEGADGLFGSDGPAMLQHADRLRTLLPSTLLRSCAAEVTNLMRCCYRTAVLRLSNHLGDLDYPYHPMNTVAAFTNLALIRSCFECDPIQYRRSVIEPYQVDEDPLNLQLSLAAGYIGEAVNTAAFWSQLFEFHGLTMFCPFLDSRMIRAAANMDIEARFVEDNPKQVLKTALARRVSLPLIVRPKRGFGQPIFEWMSAGGPLRDAVESISDHDFMPPETLQDLKAKPDWFLYNLLVYDLWYKEFIA